MGKITVLDVKIVDELTFSLIGYNAKYKDRVNFVKSQRPDIDISQLRRISRGFMMIIFYKVGKKVITESFYFEEGFIWDTASVPEFAKWLIDNDSVNMMIPSLFHDAGYGLNFFKRRFTDRLFRALVKYYGIKYDVKMPRFKALVAWFGPASPVGKRIYNSIKPEEHFNHGLCRRVI